MVGNLLLKEKNGVYICLISLVILVIGNIYLPEAAHAQLSSCYVSLIPQSVAPNSDTFFTFGIYDSDPNPIQWIQIVGPPGGYLNIESAEANGWGSSASLSTATFTGNTLGSGSSQGFIVEAYAGSTATTSPIDWTVQASDDPGGANPINCTGDTSMSIVVQPSIINILTEDVTDVYPTQVTIQWTTDTPSTSEVSYSTDTTYSSSTPTTDEGLVTNHSVTLTGLTPNTGYHFVVTSTVPSNGGTVTSSDDTFLTAAQQPSNNKNSGRTSNNQQVISSSSNSVPLLKTPDETTPPTISFIGSIPKVQKTMPTISGIATDKVAIATVQFSTDDGVNWLPAQQITGLGTQHATFSFTPVNLDDGTYNLVARAINTSDIVASTPVNVVVIDRLPPLIGADVISLGPQVLSPNQQGIINSMAGVDQKISLGTVGGPTSVTLTAINLRGQAKPQVFNLTNSGNNGLWSGIINFAKPGPYTLIANSIDGAGEHNTRVLNEFSVYPASSTINAASNKPVMSKVTIYYYVPETGTWAVWDGSSYGQSNPDNTGKNGDFGLFLPMGKYYLTAQSPGYHMLTSSMFTMTQTEPISVVLKLSSIYQIKLGPIHMDLELPSFSDQPINTGDERNNDSFKPEENSLVDRIAPNFNLSETNGSTISAANLLGKPTVITFGATWSPTMAEQLDTLSQLQANSNLNIVPVALQQGAAITKAYTTISGLNLNWLVDPSSTLTASYNVQSLPTSYFINREGVIKKVVVGVMGYQQMLTTLTDLD